MTNPTVYLSDEARPQPDVPKDFAAPIFGDDQVGTYRSIPRKHRAVERGIITRRLILEANLDAIRYHGFLSLRPDKVVQTLGVTKGALYHYFPTKTALGFAIIDEIVAPAYINRWDSLLSTEYAPLERITMFLASLGAELNNDNISQGDVLSRLIAEMSSQDPGYQLRFDAITQRMQQSAKACITLGQKEGSIRQTMNPDALAWMLLANVKGAYLLAQTSGDPAVFMMSTRSLIKFMISL